MCATPRVRVHDRPVSVIIVLQGGGVRIVNGRGRGETGTLVRLDEEGFCVSVRLDDGRILDKIEYEDVCKLAK